MDKLSELSRGAQIVLGASVAFFIVLFFHWQEVNVSGIISVGQSGWHGVGIICGLLALVLIVWQAIRLANIKVEVGVTPSMITAALAVLLVIFTIIKFLADNEFRTFWAWLGLALSIVIVVGAWMNMQAAGESLGDVREKMSTMAASVQKGSTAAGSADAARAPEPPAPEPPAAPAPPPPVGEPPADDSPPA
jgi:hypothetical protein